MRRASLKLPLIYVAFALLLFIYMRLSPVAQAAGPTPPSGYQVDFANPLAEQTIGDVTDCSIRSVTIPDGYEWVVWSTIAGSYRHDVAYGPNSYMLISDGGSDFGSTWYGTLYGFRPESPSRQGRDVQDPDQSVFISEAWGWFDGFTPTNDLSQINNKNFSPGSSSNSAYLLHVPSMGTSEVYFRFDSVDPFCGNNDAGSITTQGAYNEEFIRWALYPLFFANDGAAPTTTGSISGTLGNDDWYISDVTVELTATDTGTPTASGVSAINLDGTPEIGDTLTRTYSLDGNILITFFATDNNGNAENPPQTANFKIDQTEPELTVGFSGSLGDSVTLTGTATDATSGLDSAEISLDGGITYTPLSVDASGDWSEIWDTTALGDGNYSIELRATDVAGNTATLSQPVIIDNSAPTANHSFNGTTGDNGWYTSSVEVTLTATDAVSSIADIYYDGTPYTGPVTINVEGETTFQYYAEDAAGNTSAVTQVTVRVDSVEPTVDTALPALDAWLRGVAPIEGFASDATSGVSSVEVSTDGGATWQPVTGTTTWSSTWDTTAETDGTSYEVQVRATDIAGNISALDTIPIQIDNTLPIVTVTDIPDDFAQGPQTLGGTASDATSGLDTVEYSDDGGLTWNPVTGAANWTLDIDADDLPRGSNTLLFRGTDIAGNTVTEQATFIAGPRPRNDDDDDEEESTAPAAAPPTLTVDWASDICFNCGEAIAIAINASGNVAETAVIISGGGVEPRVLKAPVGAFDGQLVWDGLDGAGAPVGPGTYTVWVGTKGADTPYTIEQGTVTVLGQRAVAAVPDASTTDNTDPAASGNAGTGSSGNGDVVIIAPPSAPVDPIPEPQAGQTNPEAEPPAISDGLAGQTQPDAEAQQPESRPLDSTSIFDVDPATANDFTTAAGVSAATLLALAAASVAASQLSQRSRQYNRDEYERTQPERDARSAELNKIVQAERDRQRAVDELGDKYEARAEELKDELNGDAPAYVSYDVKVVPKYEKQVIFTGFDIQEERRDRIEYEALVDENGDVRIDEKVAGVLVDYEYIPIFEEKSVVVGYELDIKQHYNPPPPPPPPPSNSPFNSQQQMHEFYQWHGSLTEQERADFDAIHAMLPATAAQAVYNDGYSADRVRFDLEYQNAVNHNLAETFLSENLGRLETHYPDVVQKIQQQQQQQAQAYTAASSRAPAWGYMWKQVELPVVKTRQVKVKNSDGEYEFQPVDIVEGTKQEWVQVPIEVGQSPSFDYNHPDTQRQIVNAMHRDGFIDEQAFYDFHAGQANEVRQLKDLQGGYDPETQAMQKAKETLRLSQAEFNEQVWGIAPPPLTQGQQADVDRWTGQALDYYWRAIEQRQYDNQYLYTPPPPPVPEPSADFVTLGLTPGNREQLDYIYATQDVPSMQEAGNALAGDLLSAYGNTLAGFDNLFDISPEQTGTERLAQVGKTITTTTASAYYDLLEQFNAANSITNQMNALERLGQVGKTTLVNTANAYNVALNQFDTMYGLTDDLTSLERLARVSQSLAVDSAQLNTGFGEGIFNKDWQQFNQAFTEQTVDNILMGAAALDVVTLGAASDVFIENDTGRELLAGGVEAAGQPWYAGSRVNAVLAAGWKPGAQRQEERQQALETVYGTDDPQAFHRDLGTMVATGVATGAIAAGGVGLAVNTGGLATTPAAIAATKTATSIGAGAVAGMPLGSGLALAFDIAPDLIAGQTIEEALRNTDWAQVGISGVEGGMFGALGGGVGAGLQGLTQAGTIGRFGQLGGTFATDLASGITWDMLTYGDTFSTSLLTNTAGFFVGEALSGGFKSLDFNAAADIRGIDPDSAAAIRQSTEWDSIQAWKRSNNTNLTPYQELNLYDRLRASDIDINDADAVLKALDDITARGGHRFELPTAGSRDILDVADDLHQKLDNLTEVPPQVVADLHRHLDAALNGTAEAFDKFNAIIDGLPVAGDLKRLAEDLGSVLGGGPTIGMTPAFARGGTSTVPLPDTSTSTMDGLIHQARLIGENGGELSVSKPGRYTADIIKSAKSRLQELDEEVREDFMYRLGITEETDFTHSQGTLPASMIPDEQSRLFTKIVAQNANSRLDVPLIGIAWLPSGPDIPREFEEYILFDFQRTDGRGTVKEYYVIDFQAKIDNDAIGTPLFEGSRSKYPPLPEGYWYERVDQDGITVYNIQHFQDVITTGDYPYVDGPLPDLAIDFETVELVRDNQVNRWQGQLSRAAQAYDSSVIYEAGAADFVSRFENIAHQQLAFKYWPIIERLEANLPDSVTANLTQDFAEGFPNEATYSKFRGQVRQYIFDDINQSTEGLTPEDAIAAQWQTLSEHYLSLPSNELDPSVRGQIFEEYGNQRLGPDASISVVANDGQTQAATLEPISAEGSSHVELTSADGTITRTADGIARLTEGMEQAGAPSQNGTYILDFKSGAASTDVGQMRDYLTLVGEHDDIQGIITVYDSEDNARIAVRTLKDKGYFDQNGYVAYFNNHGNLVFSNPNS